jgi:hypothetical protein
MLRLPVDGILDADRAGIAPSGETATTQPFAWEPPLSESAAVQLIRPID